MKRNYAICACSAHALTALFVRYNVIGGRETTVMETAVYETATTLRTTKEFRQRSPASPSSLPMPRISSSSSNVPASAGLLRPDT